MEAGVSSGAMVWNNEIEVEEWKSGRVEEWKSGRVEEWKSRRRRGRGRRKASRALNNRAAAETEGHLLETKPS
jgi:hypothetical protein